MLDRILSGITVLGATIVAVIVTGGDTTIAWFTVPMGLYCLFGKNPFED